MFPSSALLLLALAGGSLSCGGGSAQSRPLVSAGTSTRSARAMLVLRDAWNLEALRSPEPRAVLTRTFSAFVEDFKGDPQVPLAHVYLAFLAMSEGDLGNANAHLRVIDGQKPGWVRDFATVGNARFLRLTGNAKGGLELLKPLVGKFVDQQALSLFLEEIAMSALAAGDELFAIERISEWVAHAAPEEQDDARRRVEGLLSSVGVKALEQALNDIRKGRFQTSPDLARMMTERLATIAIETNNVALARWLAQAEARSETSDVNARLHELASREQETVRGRTIGLLLSTANSELRDMAAESARGVAWALGLPRNRLAGERELKLVTRDDGGKLDATEAGLDELAGVGASVIIAGLDEATSERALRWAEKAHVALITLAAPRAAAAKMEYGFVVGEAIRPSLELLADALTAAGQVKIAPIVDSAHVRSMGEVMAARTDLVLYQPSPCEARGDLGALPREDWEKKGFRTWLVAGTDRCARDMMRALGSSRGATFALALDALGPLDLGNEVRVYAAGAGSLPVTSTAPADIAEFTKSFGGVPDWTTALGRDAGVLASRALETLPTDETSEHKLVQERRTEARNALAVAKARLWTSEESGFGSNHRLARKVRVVALTKSAMKR